MTTILIADDHDVVRSGLRNILECKSNWQIVGEASNGREAIDRAIETSPDIALLDYSMPLLNGVEAARQIRAQLPKTEVLIFTMHQNEMLLQQLRQAGARGYLLKSDAKHNLIKAIEALAAHKPFFSAGASDALDNSSGAHRLEKSVLTDRERQVVQLIAEGNANKQVGKILNISSKTVETHRAAVMRKLALSSSASLVRYAVRNGMLHA